MPLTGFEPATYSLGGNRSNPTELQGLSFFEKVHAGERILEEVLVPSLGYRTCSNPYAGERIRTFVSTKLMGPKPIPFDHSGTPA